MLFSLTHDEAVAALRTHGVAAARASALYRAVFQRGVSAVAEIPEFAGAEGEAARCAERMHGPSSRIADRVEADGVLKFVTVLHDGARIESVLIPGPGRETLCLSSQVGCRRGCRFCATGRMGFVRNLSAEEIVGQVFAARFALGWSVHNVVFMGMGEPLDNLEAVCRSIAVLTDPRGLNIARGRITVSTAGQAEGLHQLGLRKPGNLGIALSLNSADDHVRSDLMPINREFSLIRLKSELQAYPLGSRGVFFIEYVLLAGVNDSPDAARAMIAFLAGLPVRVNLIVYNPVESSLYTAPAPDGVRRFREILSAAGLFVRVRPARGCAARAACGQLACGVAAGEDPAP